MNLIGSKIDEVRIDGSLERFTSDLEKLKSFNLQAVELPVHGLDIILNGQINAPRLKATLEILQAFDFEYSIHAPNPLNLMDQKRPALHVDVMQATLEFARRVNAKVVVYHGGRFIPEEEFSVTGYRTLSTREKRSMLEREAVLLQTAAELYPDVTIAIENARPYLSQSPYTYAESIQDLKQQVVDIDRKNVRINLDVGHLYMTSRFYGYDLLEAVRQIQALVAHTHIHDNFGHAVHHFEKQQTHQLPFGRGDSHMPVGWGDLAIKPILDILLPEYQGLLMMELRSRYFNDIPASRTNLEALLAA